MASSVLARRELCLDLERPTVPTLSLHSNVATCTQAHFGHWRGSSLVRLVSQYQSFLFRMSLPAPSQSQVLKPINLRLTADLGTLDQMESKRIPHMVPCLEYPKGRLFPRQTFGGHRKTSFGSKSHLVLPKWSPANHFPKRTLFNMPSRSTRLPVSHLDWTYGHVRPCLSQQAEADAGPSSSSARAASLAPQGAKGRPEGKSSVKPASAHSLF